MKKLASVALVVLIVVQEGGAFNPRPGQRNNYPPTAYDVATPVPWLGIWAIADTRGGVRIVGFQPLSHGLQIGLEVGDRIWQMNGVVITHPAQLNQTLGRTILGVIDARTGTRQRPVHAFRSAR